MKNNGLKNAKAITLIAMVVTIIVLLILAGVSIAVLTGENGIINRATEAKATSKIAEIEEQANLEYTAMLIGQLSGETSENVALAAVCTTLRDRYKLPIQPITTDAPTVTGVIFTSENVTKSNGGTVGAISIAQGTESTVITAEAVVTPATGSWYAVVEGKYYKIDIPTGQNKIKIERTETDVSGGNNTPAVTYSVKVEDSNKGVTVNETTGAISVANNATGNTQGKVDIIASVGNNISATCTVTVLKYVTVTITAGAGGTLGQSSSTTGSYLEGRSIPLVATPSEGYKFVRWDKTINSETTQIGTNATTNYTVPGTDVTITAVFAESAVNLGTEVTIGTQKFYVVKKFIEGNVDKVALLSKYNLRKPPTDANAADTLEQYNANYEETAMSFSQNRYWLDEWNNASGTARIIDLNKYRDTMPEGETTRNNAILRAKEYASSLGITGAKGRLLTYEEAYVYSNNTACLFGTGKVSTTILYGQYTGADKVGGSEGNGCLYSWLASSDWISDIRVWYVIGYGSDLDRSAYNYPGNHGVRPVIEVPESAIQ